MLAFQMTEGMWTLLIAQLATLIAGAVKMWWDIRKREEDRLDREQDRLDRIQLAQLTQEQLDAVEASGNAREKKLVGEIRQTRALSILAFKEANGVNKKIESLGQQLVDDKAREPSPPPDR